MFRFQCFRRLSKFAYLRSLPHLFQNNRFSEHFFRLFVKTFHNRLRRLPSAASGPAPPQRRHSLFQSQSYFFVQLRISRFRKSATIILRRTHIKVSLAKLSFSHIGELIMLDVPLACFFCETERVPQKTFLSNTFLPRRYLMTS